MSRKERDRLTIMIGIKRKELTLVATGELMALSSRQGPARVATISNGG